MKRLAQGIMQLFNTDNELREAIGGRLFNTRVPVGTPLPYVVFTIDNNMQSDTFSESISDIDIQFSIYSGSSSSEEVEDIYEKLISLYDDAEIEVEDAVLVTMTRQNASLDSVEADTVSGSEEYWQYDVNYNCILQQELR